MPFWGPYVKGILLFGGAIFEGPLFSQTLNWSLKGCTGYLYCSTCRRRTGKWKDGGDVEHSYHDYAKCHPDHGCHVEKTSFL